MITRTEAAETMATDVLAFAHQHGLPVTKSLVEARISEWRGLAGEGSYKGACAKLASVRTTLTIARRWHV
jgi:hypothetical protein